MGAALHLWLIPVGFAVGAVGTLIGAGGGFVLVPILLLLYPERSPELVTSMSLAVVYFNAFSGTCAYARLKRIDYRSGLVFALATVPGAVLGALTTHLIPRRVFDGVFGGLLLVLAVFLVLQRHREHLGCDVPPSNGQTIRTVVDSNGSRYTFSFSLFGGIVLSLVVGYLSSALGVGGGVIHVPALIRLLHFPAHIATATSHFILTFTSLAGTVVHIAYGVFSQGATGTLCLAIGALMGAQLGAWVSGRLRGVWIIRCLAVALGFVGVRVLVMAL